ncbi:MAG: carboxypeptidase M32 [Desulfotalea sp.]|nr:MAG: carboxypeptidase M32 [Desulfotalea sp.]
MNESYKKLIDHFGKLAHIEHALTFLQWDHMVMMPPGGNSSRSAAIAELTSLHHQQLTSEKTAELLEEAHATTPIEQQSIKEMRREYQQAICLPDDLVRAQSLAGSKCEHDWRGQRQENDWNGFLHNFKEVVSLARQEAQARFDTAITPLDTPYDAMLELYCIGDSAGFIADIFARLRSELPPLIHLVMEQQKTVTKPHFTSPYTLESQKNLSHQLMKSLGFNFDQGRMDVSAHPFSTGCRGDQRITTRFRDNDFLDALLSTAHETGHASYEAGLPEEWDNLPIGRARNLSLHESQSLLFEKQIFLSAPFLRHFTSFIHKHLPTTSTYCGRQIRDAAISVQPSYIRVEADEVTYPLHIILRFEIEKELINGVIKADDIPELWDQKMQEYLGLSTKDNYKDGCMQDMHWTDGSFGYFPSYTMGALNSAQFFATIKKANPNWKNNLDAGDISFATQWLHENIWSKASSMDAQEIIIAATGEKTNADFFINHLNERYIKNLY